MITLIESLKRLYSKGLIGEEKLNSLVEDNIISEEYKNYIMTLEESEYMTYSEVAKAIKEGVNKID